MLAFLVVVIFYFTVHVKEGAGAGDFFLKTLPTFLILFLIEIFIVYGFSRKVPVYKTVCKGAKEGFNVALRIIPFLVAICVAISIFRSSGAFGVMSDLVNAAPDSRSAFIVSIMQGSTETTFYVLAVYFRSIEVTRARQAIAAALFADHTGVMAAVFRGNYFYKGF